MFGALILIVTAAYYIFMAYAIASFWVAYILTRPLGASFGDLLAQPLSNGGLGLGTTVTSEVFLAAILSLVLFLTFSRRDTGKQESNA